MLISLYLVLKFCQNKQAYINGRVIIYTIVFKHVTKYNIIYNKIPKILNKHKLYI